MAGCRNPICRNAHCLLNSILYCLPVGSATEGLPPALQTAFFNLDKTTAIREAELLRIEASLAATPREGRALASRPHPHASNKTGIGAVNSDRN